ncbi:M48 family metallopeptidase [Sphingomonas morindae]|uniref:M48 family metallopeptidase n=1 Tax=Sphingomonas morindae TaxID=1541170 RepID=A0ABY4XB98_9SPHN|nr:SprT family zinc-dependent metalloprotease [Sphingomonas morindae]USI74252.1 M48 family metallopeptidase [Sphingomonas morindae]
MISEPRFSAGGLSRTLEIRRVATARGLRLTVDPRDGAVRLSMPPRHSEAKARAWAESKRGWIEAALARLPVPAPIRPGGRLPFRGAALTLDWQPDAARRPLLEGQRLRVGGPLPGFARRVLDWARREALAQLEAETRALAAEAGVTVGRVAIGDPRGRWGSCSASGDIRYSWRLILAPPFVLSATVAHEVAHRLHMDHSPAFKAAERRLAGDPGPARAWLRAHGASLHWIGREPEPDTLV